MAQVLMNKNDLKPAQTVETVHLTQDISPNDDTIQFLIHTKKYAQARKLIQQNIQAAGASFAWDTALQNYETLIAIDSITHDFHAAFNHLKEKEKLMQESLIFHKNKVFNDTTRRQSVKTEHLKIVELEERLRKTEENIHFRIQMIVLTIVVAVLLLAAIFALAFRYKKDRRLNNAMMTELTQIQHQQEEMTGMMQRNENENQQLTKDNQQLVNINAMKDKLLSVISHDLRSPISSLQALLALFNTNNIARADLVDFFGKLLSRVENTSTMLENLLHWSHYQLKGFEPIFNRVDLQNIIDECIFLYRMQAEQKHIVIDNSLKTTVHVSADVEMLKVILRNLISNALKFTRSGGIITIMTMTKENYAIISVKDTGIGISPENQVKLFAIDNFTTPGTEKEKGTGLGLKLCKDFVEQNHGKIWLDSKINVGTTFYFSIPLSEVV